MYPFGFLLFLVSFLHPSTDIFWNHLPDKLLAIGSLSQGLFGGNPNHDIP